MSGSFNPINMVSQIALGVATGGASLVAQLAVQVAMQMGQQLIQNLGEQLGLPQQAIDLAKDAMMGAATGGIAGAAAGAVAGGGNNLAGEIEQAGQQTGATPSQIGEAQGEAERTLQSIQSDLAQSEDVKDAKAGGGKGKGWLMALASVLGAKMDDLADQMGTMAREISDGAASKSSEFTVLAQEFGLIMNAANTSIKTIGEAMNNMARKS